MAGGTKGGAKCSYLEIITGLWLRENRFFLRVFLWTITLHIFCKFLFWYRDSGFAAEQNNLEKPVKVKRREPTTCTCLLLIWRKLITTVQGRADGRTAKGSPSGSSFSQEKQALREVWVLQLADQISFTILLKIVSVCVCVCVCVCDTHTHTHTHTHLKAVQC